MTGKYRGTFSGDDNVLYLGRAFGCAGKCASHGNDKQIAEL